MVLPKRAEKEKEKATTVAPELESEPAPGVSTEERDEVAPQLAVQKKPVKARLLRARKGVATETSVVDIAQYAFIFVWFLCTGLERTV
ncbi:hypothetical protein K503DRAFT_806645 [Rhizopogon vinicolor AM-OR11-026]|uniref:Uncharacterized protein n=1 Tax=Rhizopogon vinicolor AM-OR11-026 TaxID=1314800 RepID=A0A1B7ME25_9AGAM|nr:hypothetical protein K503DRAFT_806645 [Rhizopogon vinicolor AM-OR11-026]